jgi:hypothetical protein
MAGSAFCAIRSSPRADSRKGHPAAAPGRASHQHSNMSRCRLRGRGVDEVLVKADTIGVSMPEVLVRSP